MNSTVSIVTVTNLKRVNYLEILIDCLREQKYEKIMEWVIVNGDPEGGDELEKFLEKVQIPKISKITYIKLDHKNGIRENIGVYRNMYNRVAKGDIIVCCDDDDYYAPNYVSECVSTLKKAKAQICGIQNLRMYDMDLDRCLEMKKMTDNSASSVTNNSIAYLREILYVTKEGEVKDEVVVKYDENVSHGEERSFLEKIQSNAVNLDKRVMLHFSHYENTYNKREILISNLDPTRSPSTKYAKEIRQKLEELIPENYARRYRSILEEKLESEKFDYDIVYYCGNCIEWSPKDKNLGGSEQAVKHLTENWAKRKSVIVYGNIKEIGKINGVMYDNYKNFKAKRKYKTLIIWRHLGMNMLYNNLRAEKILIDLHDNLDITYYQCEILKDKISHIMFKSDFHVECASKLLQREIEKAVVIPNGIRISNFSKNKWKRKQFRMCYCSCYTRGLLPLLRYFFPVLKKLVPEAELHVYYGMEHVSKEFKDQITPLLKQNGVHDHGRQSIDEIVKEKHKSSFHLYYTDCLGEIDCISIRESLVAGCIPILSNENLFEHRDGIRFMEPTHLVSSYEKLAHHVSMLMKNKQLTENFSAKLRHSKTIISWEDVSDQWLDIINSHS